MPKRSSVLKRIRQSEKRKERNKGFKSYLKGLIRKFESTNELEEKKKILSLVYSALDKAVSKGILHENTAARKKSKLTRKLLKSGG